MPRPTHNTASRGVSLAGKLARGKRNAERAPRAGARDLPILHGVTPSGVFRLTQENVLLQARQILCDSRRVYSYGDSIVVAITDAGEERLVTVSSDGHAEPHAASMLANLMVCEHAPGGNVGTLQFRPPNSFVEVLFCSEPTRAALPRIEVYASRPVFDGEYRFLGNGWHADAGVLVHGVNVEPIIPPLVSAGDARSRLPRHLRQLLSGFCFMADADVVNAVGALLTGLLPTHFRHLGKGLIILDGNQPGIGKTLLARTIGVVLDGGDPRLTSFSADDEEISKRTCATLRGNRQSILIFDNAKTTTGRPISSPFIESNSMAANVTLRILGQSLNIDRPNDMLWSITMNNTKTSPDLVSRGLPIRLQYDGRPEDRRFDGNDPLAFAREHRADILSELAGMVVRWNQAGRPQGNFRHRCRQWAGVIGGILQANGLPEFLTNLDEAAGEFNSELDELAALAEAAVSREQAVVFITHNSDE